MPKPTLEDVKQWARANGMYDDIFKRHVLLEDGTIQIEDRSDEQVMSWLVGVVEPKR